MHSVRLLSAALLCFLPVLSLHAQDQGNWRAASKTARGVTGDLYVTATKISINYSTFPLAQIRALQPDEARALFQSDAGQGNLYRVDIPADKRFLHHNTLCGSEPTDWVITFVSGKELQLAFLTGPSIPTLTVDALDNSTRLCGTYAYVR